MGYGEGYAEGRKRRRRYGRRGFLQAAHRLAHNPRERRVRYVYQSALQQEPRIRLGVRKNPPENRERYAESDRPVFGKRLSRKIMRLREVFYSKIFSC